MIFPPCEDLLAAPCCVMKRFLSSTRSLPLLRAVGTEARCYDSQTGAAETSNGKRKIRNEKQDKFQMAVKKLVKKGHECQPKFVFSKLPVFQHENDKVTEMINSFFFSVR